MLTQAMFKSHIHTSGYIKLKQAKVKFSEEIIIYIFHCFISLFHRAF